MQPRGKERGWGGVQSLQLMGRASCWVIGEQKPSGPSSTRALPGRSKLYAHVKLRGGGTLLPCPRRQRERAFLVPGPPFHSLPLRPPDRVLGLIC